MDRYTNYKNYLYGKLVDVFGSNKIVRDESCKNSNIDFIIKVDKDMHILIQYSNKEDELLNVTKEYDSYKETSGVKHVVLIFDTNAHVSPADKAVIKNHCKYIAITTRPTTDQEFEMQLLYFHTKMITEFEDEIDADNLPGLFHAFVNFVGPHLKLLPPHMYGGFAFIVGSYLNKKNKFTH